MKKQLMFTLAFFCTQAAVAGPNTQDVKRQGESQIRKIAEPLLAKYCKEQCQIVKVETEIAIMVDEAIAPGFEESTSKAELAPSGGKIKFLVDESIGTKTREKLTDLLKENLETLGFPVQVEAKITKFPQPESSGYRVADLKERVSRDIKASLQTMLAQFCPEACMLGEFEVQTETINPEDIPTSSGQDYFQDGPAAVRVRGVKASIITDQSLTPAEAVSIVEMAKLKVAGYKNSSVTSQVMNFPKPTNKDLKSALANGNATGKDGSQENKETKNTNESKELKDSRESKDSKSLQESKDLKDTREVKNSTANDNKQEKIEKYERIERVENGDAVQQTLEKFRMYGIVLSSIMLALLVTLVAIGFRKQIFERGGERQSESQSNKSNSAGGSDGRAGLTSDEKTTLISKRIEVDRLYNDLTHIYSEHPKVAKHVFTHVLTEEGVETTAQYLEIFGESVVMDLLRDPGLQSDLTELMDFYARNTFDLNDDEKLLLLKKLHHRTVSGKMQVHGSRSAALFDFLGEMDTPQIIEMIKNESNTVKAIILTQCDQKKRQVIFNQHDDVTRLKLMTELSRIDHLPKNYIYNVATALRRKKMENPKLNTEALPGTDVLVSFLEKADAVTQRSIVHQLMGTAGGDSIQNLKTKLVSLETLRYVKDAQMTEIITGVKHEEVVQMLKGCNEDIRRAVLTKAPGELSAELSDALALTENVTREAFYAVERKILNRMKTLANNGQMNLAEINERMFSEEFGFQNQTQEVTTADIRRVA